MAPQRPPERRGLTYNDCLELAYTCIYPDGHPSESTVYTGPTLSVIPEEPPDRQGLAHNDCSESAYMGLYPDDHPSESTAYTDLNLTTIPREPLERRGLAHNDCSESAYAGIHLDGHPSESTAYTGPTLTATREKQPIRLSLREPPKKWGLAHNDCSESTYTGLHPDGHPSESTIYTSST